MTHTTASLASALGAQLVGDASITITGVASLASAGPTQLVFVEDAKWLPQALASNAGAILAGEFAADAAIPAGKSLLLVRHPRLAFCRAAAILREESTATGTVHSSALVRESAQLAVDVQVGPFALVGKNVVIGEGSRIGAYCFIADGTVIGTHCALAPHVTIYPGVTIGDRVIVHAGAVLGSDGFGYVRDPESGRYEKFPQIGTLEIGNDVEIGANATIDRGALDATTIADGVKLDNMVHIGHNVRIAENVVIAAQTGVSGSSIIEKDVVVGGQVGIGDHVRIAEGAILGAQSGIPSKKVIRGKGVVFWGTPARPLRDYLKELAVLARLARKP